MTHPFADRRQTFHTEGELLDKAIARTEERIRELLKLISRTYLYDKPVALAMERSVLAKLEKVKHASLHHPRT